MEYSYDPQNVFARILRGEIPCKKVHETAHTLSFHDIAPQADVHVMLIPKGPYVSMDHFARDASAEEQLDFFKAFSELCDMLPVEKGFRAIANSREHSHQEVPHFHLHILGGHPLGRLLPDRHA